MSAKIKKGKKAGLKDDRFAHLQSDPKYNTISNISRKVVLEKRFASALTDERFSTKARVDKRGRKLKPVTENELASLYDIEKEEDSDDGNMEPAIKKNKENDGSDGESSDDEEDTEQIDKPKLDLARGQGNLSSSESDSEESDWELPEENEADIDFSQLDEDAERVEWASCRLAACNLDWEIIKADDLLVMVQSFKPPGGIVKSVSIYLSDFGKERLDLEDKSGPRLNLEKPIEEYNLNNPDSETTLAMRQYQLDRLKYYYAVLEFDSEGTASAVYEQCDGFLFESTGLKMDLRFVPDDMEFEEDRLKERVLGTDVNVDNYRAKQNTRSAIANTGSILSWDQGDIERTRKVKDAYNNDAAMCKDLMGSDSEDEETTAKRKDALLSLLNEKGDRHDLQIEWDGDDDKSAQSSDGEDDSDVGSDIEKALARDARKGHQESDDEGDSDASETPAPVAQPVETAVKKSGYLSYLERKKDKKKERKQKLRAEREAEKEALRLAEEGAKQRLKETIKIKKSLSKAETEDTKLAEAVASDNRFKALFTDSSFAIEQSSNQFKGSKLISKQAEVKKSLKDSDTVQPDDLLAKLKTKSGDWNKKKMKKTVQKN